MKVWVCILILTFSSLAICKAQYVVPPVTSNWFLKPGICSHGIFNVGVEYKPGKLSFEPGIGWSFFSNRGYFQVKYAIISGSVGSIHIGVDASRLYFYSRSGFKREDRIAPMVELYYGSLSLMVSPQINSLTKKSSEDIHNYFTPIIGLNLSCPIVNRKKYKE